LVGRDLSTSVGTDPSTRSAALRAGIFGSVLILRFDKEAAKSGLTVAAFWRCLMEKYWYNVGDDLDVE